MHTPPHIVTVCVCVCVLRMLKIYSQLILSIWFSSISCSCHAGDLISRTYSSYNCKFIPFDKYFSISLSPWTYFASMSLRFSDIIWVGTWSICLLGLTYSLSRMFSSVINIVARGRISFFLKDWIPLFIYSYVSKHLFPTLDYCK
jgi:hypothetical protein